MIPFFTNWKIRYKLLVSYSFAFLLTVSLGSLIIYAMARRSIEDRLESELNNTTTAILNMIHTTASVSIKNHLKTIAVQNYQIVQDLYSRYLRGELSEADARRIANDILLSQSIGTTGYIYCMSSDGVIKVHPKKELIGTDLSNYAFTRTLKKQRVGYLEYNWQNPDETRSRPKAVYTTYFEPWDWIIAASSYRQEFQNLIDLDDFRDSIRTLRFGETGYALIYDMVDKKMIRPVSPSPFFPPNHLQYTELIEEVTGQPSGKRVIKVSSGQKSQKVIVFFTEIPEFQWVVICLNDYAEVYAPLFTIRYAMIFLIGISLLLFLPLTFWISASITRPLHQLMDHITAGIRGDVSGRIDIRTFDEVGQLSRFFNTFMARLELSAKELKIEMQEREKAEEAIRDSEKKYRELVENANSIILRIDPQGKINFINRYALEFFDYTPEQMIGQVVTGTIMPREAAAAGVLAPVITEPDRSPSDDYSPSLVLENQRRSGERVWISWTRRAVVDKSGKLLEYLCIGNDMTARIKMEEMMIQTAKMMSIGGLAAGMAHEINNPLGVMVQNTQNIIRRFASDLPKNRTVAKSCGVDLERLGHYLAGRKIDRLLEDVRLSGARAAGIVSRMLNFSRRDDTRLRPTGLGELIERTLALADHDYDLKKKYDFRNIRIIKDFDPELPEVPCDAAEIQQVLLNLIKNAAQALHLGEPAGAPEMTIRLLKLSRHARIEVSDNGPGMDEETRKRIFEPFYTTKEIGDGTGLGLSVSYFIITSHHKGEMTVESAPGQGATFIIDLPLSE